MGGGYKTVESPVDYPFLLLTFSERNMKIEKMFYDEVIKSNLSGREERGKTLTQDATDRGASEREVTRSKITDIVIDKTKVFLFDEMITDSLMNVRYDKDVYRNPRNLPFPYLFFEFEEPIPFRLVDYLGLTQGIFFCKLEDSQLTKFEKKNGLMCNVFDHYSKSTFGGGIIIEDIGLIIFDEPRKGETIRHVFSMRNNRYGIGYYEDVNDAENKFDWRDYESISDDRMLDLPKLGNFLLNTVDYINAQNVVIRKRDRSQPGLERINRKRERKGKDRLPFLQPYYFVELKKKYIDEEREDKDTWTLNYRVWVRGHFRHYQDGTCIWIDPYVKGPPDSPWKETRYLALYKRFKHLLRNPKYM